MPTSTVRMPMPEAMMGPMVDPQPMSLRTTKSCMGTPARFATSRNRKLVTAVVAYLRRDTHKHARSYSAVFPRRSAVIRA